MKKKLIFLGVSGIIAVVSLTACGSKFGGANNTRTDGFEILSGENDNHFGHMAKHFDKFIGFLDLSEDQKKKLNDIKTEMASNFEGNKDKRTEMKKVLKDSFLASSINKEDLKAKILAVKPFDDTKLDKMSQTIVKVYNILTPEQKTKLEERLDKISEKVGKHMDNPVVKFFQKSPEKKFEKMTADLNLSEQQKASFKGLFETAKPDRKEMFAKMQKVRKQLQTELKAGADAGKIKEILASVRTEMESKIDTRLEKMVKIHDILTPEQRTKLVSKMEEKQKHFEKKFKSRMHSGRFGA